ncbi:hypothetical protein PUW24_09110 [Paenibacillus urinalis]|uniref:DUF3888 domain-containing protein n=1 Tax=Paenibacillus urinalis TaxID=521520 RepID=A0ABY7XA76_9BACL|nr:hypothetical protein [Paenibacillus urinalis]WDH99011.1 hypothetical protein PUW24_09110 [Paenibacillus urinalis]WDI02705.1 hypothetical protein PUW25_01565 [Paenibacillus urinalis]
MKKKKWILSFISLFILIYIAFGFWIASDTKLILEKSLESVDDYTEYMSQPFFDNTNLTARGDTSSRFTYHPENHKLGTVFALHFFFISKVFVTHEYDQPDFGFRETLTINLKLMNGHWYASNVKFNP